MSATIAYVKGIEQPKVSANLANYCGGTALSMTRIAQSVALLATDSSLGQACPVAYDQAIFTLASNNTILITRLTAVPA
jgi:hypothetical protein